MTKRTESRQVSPTDSVRNRPGIRNERESGDRMETDDLIYLVSCAVNGTTPDAKRTAGMDPDAICRLAARHRIAATVAPALEAAGIRDKRFADAGKACLLKSAVLDREMTSLFRELDAAGIWHMPLKGIVLQRLYPMYGMRQMADCDILFDGERAEDVRTVMEKLGFRQKQSSAGYHDVYRKEPAIVFEMHRTLFSTGPHDKLDVYYRDVKSRLLGSGFEKHLSPEDFYLYMTAHEYKHYSGGGTGLRSLLDTYLFLRNNEPDMNYVKTEAAKMGIAGFEAANRSLAQRLFSGKELSEADREMLDYILSSGAYGTAVHQVENAMARQKQGRLGYTLRRFRVPFSRKNGSYAAYAAMYPFFYRHRLLLPFLPFWRLFRSIRSGRFKTEAKAVKSAKT